MTDTSHHETTAADLLLHVYQQTAAFIPESERTTLGVQIRQVAVRLTTAFRVAISTDDPAEQQETLRETATTCITLESLIQVASELTNLSAEEIQIIQDQIQQIKFHTARLRRTYVVE